ncbi:hypothetical protein SAMD00019534_003580, partial [Acytostelium subglobosum LB1]|uniref:hypothetical protein n=1 Tax=Acytostelium subglobosum LB1 TaxID=1410327 RepID=UPI000644E2C0
LDRFIKIDMMDTDSDDDSDDFQPRAFQVDGEFIPGENDEEPLTGEEYLRRVRWAANRCPKVVVANIDYSKINNRPSSKYFTPPPKLTKCREELMPSAEWETHFLASFSEYRQRLQYQLSNNQPSINQSTHSIKLPHLNDKKSWSVYCFGSTPSSSSSSSSSSASAQSPPAANITTSSVGNQPSTGALGQMDHLMIVQLIEYHVEWLEAKELSKERSSWLYTLLSLLEKPIDADTSANLRSLLRRLAVLRSKIDDVNDPILPSINILITIVAKYFNQLEPDD